LVFGDWRLVIRDVTIDDAAALAPLMEQLGYPTTPVEMRTRLQAILGHPDYHAWIAEQDGRAAGMVSAWLGHSYEINGLHGRILGLVVDGTARRSGIGLRLMRTAEEWVRARGGTTVFLNSGNHRTEAHAFYRHIGYQMTGVRFFKRL
jgi:GNAT superfamily N-acetyltransferase